MNPLTNVKNINKLNEVELEKDTVDKKSWHDMYKDSAWIFIGGLAYGLTEGDILAVFSQYGEIVNINLVRDKKTGKIKGFCFLCYTNQKSTILAVDNFNGIKLCGRTIRVDHVANYRPPKENENEDDITKQLRTEGCAPKPIKIENTSEDIPPKRPKTKKVKKEKKKHKKHKKNKKKGNIKEDALKNVKIKEEKIDPGYSKYDTEKRNALRSESEDSESSSNESSDHDLNYVSHKERFNSKATDNRVRLDDSEPNRNKVDKYNGREYLKQTHTDSERDNHQHDFVKRKYDHNSDSSSKRKKIESSNSKYSAHAMPNSESSSDDHVKKYSSNYNKNSDSSNSSAFKDKSFSKNKKAKHHRHDNSSDSESDSAYMKATAEKSRENDSRSNKQRDSSYKNHKSNHSSSGLEHSYSEIKHTNSESAYRDQYRSSNSHKSYDQEKHHRHDSRLHKTDKKGRW